MEPDIYTYADYRSYLADYYARQKKLHAYFSHRYFCRRAGFKTSNVLKLLMQGRRNLSREGAAKVAAGVGLGQREREYFETLVLYCQARDPDQKRAHFARLLRLRRKASITQVQPDRFEFYSSWHHTVVREAVELPGCDGSPEWIAERMQPRSTVRKVQESLALLDRLGLITRAADGRYRAVDQALTTAPEVSSEHVAALTREMIRLGLESSLRLPRAERDVSGLTLRISRVCFEQVKRRIQELKTELLEMAVMDEGSDRVYQLNVQLFPLSR